MKTLRPIRSGFTLIEMLVVIAIIALLVSILVPAVGAVRIAGMRTQALGGIRESGNILLLRASEQDGHIKIQGGGSANDYELYKIVRDYFGTAAKRGDQELRKIVTTPAWAAEASEQNMAKKTVWGANIQDNLANGVEWETEAPPPPENNKTTQVLRMSRVKRPSRFALLADTSDASGRPWSRVDNTYRLALRYNYQAPVFTLDGSAKMIGRDLMERFYFTDAYLFDKDNPKDDPEGISVP